MNPHQGNTVSLHRLSAASIFALLLVVPHSWAQVAPAVSPDAAALAKYDKNKDGKLDASEQAAMDADQKKSVPTEMKPTDDAIQLSPFEVVTDTKGYYSSNTMSGTRFNSKIEDLGSSITVVTKEQMQDFAMLDINDVFLYTASTEGTGTYTDFTVDRNGSYSDNVEMNPQGANRVRGIGPANVTMGNVETMGRNPVDPLAIDGIEVSRGPNANISGLGSPAGTVNQVPSAANTSRDRSQVTFRADSYDGYRTSLDLNRVLVKNILAFRASGAFQHDGYGVQKLPAVITDLDPNAPIWDHAHFYADAFVTYRTKVWSNKVGATFQLNVRNIQENGRLQATSAFPDGTPSSLRIVDPRQFILQATFDL